MTDENWCVLYGEIEDFASRHEEKLHSTKQIICGGIAGCFSKTAVAPLSRVTILMQVQSMRPHKFTDGLSPNNTSLLSSLRKIYLEERIAGFWVGNGAMLVHRFPYTGITFAIQSWMKRHLDAFPQVPRKLHSFLAGGSSSMVAVTACYPLDVVRTRLTSQTGEKYYKGIWDALVKIGRDEKLSGYYRGLGLAYISAVPTIALNFAFYDHFTPVYAALDMPPAVQALGAGASAGACSSALMFPMDLLRRQMQMLGVGGRSAVYANVFDAVRQVYATGRSSNPGSLGVFLGFREFFRGLLPELIKVTPATAILFSVQSWLVGTKWFFEK